MQIQHQFRQLRMRERAHHKQQVIYIPYPNETSINGQIGRISSTYPKWLTQIAEFLKPLAIELITTATCQLV